MIRAIFDSPAPTVTLVGATVTVPPEAHFGSVESIAQYVDSVLARPRLRARYARASIPLMVRRRAGDHAAHYEPGPPPTIAIPTTGSLTGQTRDTPWALRETVVLHEVTHHLDDSGGAAHGAEFVDTLIDLVGDVLGPEAALIYRVMMTPPN